MRLRRLISWLIPGAGPLFDQPEADRTFGDSVRALLALRYPPAANHYPNLPRGALTRIADEVGCSRGYAAAVARKVGYHQEGRV